ncbi:MAG TPA: flagellar hook-associated protein FlgL [Solirubrobacteraceae bacterium]|nr:flagellar hook-associated protein FlgL [Solirubrobacteraceae bacterium]
MTTRIATDMIVGSTLADINSAQAALERSQRELSSGKSISQPSDNPVGASQAIMLQSALDGLDSYEKSAHDGSAWLKTAGGALSSLNELTQRARELVVQAANGVNSQGDLNDIADEVEQLTEMAKQDADTQYAGQYIFSGTLAGTAPYAQGANDEYHGNSGAIARSVGPGATIDVTVSVKSLLGEGQAAGDGKLLDTLRTIAKNLREGTPEALKALSGHDLEAIEANLSTLGNLQAEVGAATDQITSALNRVEDLQNTTTTQLSNIQDANFAQVSMEFSSQQAAYNAALRAGASIVQESLLEFLH